MTLPDFLRLLFLFIASDTIAAGLAGYILWSHRRNGNGGTREMVGLSLLMLAICAEGAATLVAVAFGFRVAPVYTVGYALTFLLGRLTRSAALWAFVVVLFRKKT